MSFSIDVNVLLYAADRGNPRNERALAFLERAAAGPELVALTWPTVMAFLRISTHSGIFGNPLTPAEAESDVEALLRLPHVRLLSEEEGFWEVYRQVTKGLIVRGNLVPDAHLAALLRQHGVSTLYSNDSDFRKFDFLRLRNPFE